MIRPATTKITLPFGATTAPYTANNPHIGVDFSSSPDNTVYMPEDGTVRLYPTDGTCGRSIHIYVDNRHHALCHTSKYLVSDGQFVKKGTPVAIMGETGLAFGVHLHWALKINNQFVNPLDYVNEGEDMPTLLDRSTITSMARELLNRQPTDEELNEQDGKPMIDLYRAWTNSNNPERKNIENLLDLGIQANKEGWTPGSGTGEFIPYNGKQLFLKKG